MACETNEDIDLWKKYEEIAMHFNDLIIQLRMRALGGLALITTILGFVSKDDATKEFSWGLIVISLLALILIWIAIWILDARYYSRLLKGAVEALKVLESNEGLKTEKLKLQITLSTDIENETYKKSKKRNKYSDARVQFYSIVFIALVGCTIFSGIEYFDSIPRQNSSSIQALKIGTCVSLDGSESQTKILKIAGYGNDAYSTFSYTIVKGNTVLNIDYKRQTKSDLESQFSEIECPIADDTLDIEKYLSIQQVPDRVLKK